MKCEIDVELHKQQGVAYSTPATEVLYGGAAGGGKSHLMRVAAMLWCAAVPGLQVYLFRRIREDLVKNHIEGPKGFRALLAPLVLSGLITIVEDEIKWWNGSKIYLCHCKDEKDRFKYLGAEIHVLLIDELTTFTEVIYRFLRGRVRAVGLKLPPQLVGMFPRILCGSNPGGIGHHFVKSAFIDGATPLAIREMSDEEGGMRRQYIPAKLTDNPSMAQDDPKYRARLRGLGSPALVKAMEDGDWNVVAGAFFTEFSTERHVIKPFTIPTHWARLRAGDWGSAKPFSFGWYAVSDGEFSRIPRGALVKYREWYGVKLRDPKDPTSFEPNIGLKLTAEQVADGIRSREVTGTGASGEPIYERIDHSVLDPAAFTRDGGPSIAERMATQAQVYFSHADNARVARGGAMGGWDALRSRLNGETDEDNRPIGPPMLFLFENCVHTIRTLPVLQHDEHRPEDVDSDGEDHAGDETRYACMSRPWVKTAAPPPKAPRGAISIQEMIDRYESRQTENRRI